MATSKQYSWTRKQEWKHISGRSSLAHCHQSVSAEHMPSCSDMHTMIVDCPSIRGLMRNQMLTDKIQQASHHMPMPCMRLFALTPARGGVLLAFLEPWASLNASLAALFAPWPRAQATSPPRHPTRIKNTESEDWPGGRGRHQAGSSWCAPCARLPIGNRIPPPIAAPTWSAPAILPVLGHDAHTGDWTGSCGLSCQKI